MSYKLHEFLHDPSCKENLRIFYKNFFVRSKPLTFDKRTISDYYNKIDEHFDFLCENFVIITAFQNERPVISIVFDFTMKYLKTSDSQLKFVNQFNQPECCELIFAASDNKSLLEVQFCSQQIFQYIKNKYNKKYIFGNVNRQHKKEKYKKTIKRIFDFTILEDDFTFHEIP